MINYSVHHGIVGEEGYDAHPALAFRTDERVDFINLTNHLGPAAAGDPWTLLLDDQEIMLRYMEVYEIIPKSISDNHNLAIFGYSGFFETDWKIIIIDKISTIP